MVSVLIQLLWNVYGHPWSYCILIDEKKKVFAMSQIRSDILYTRKIKETRECKREMQRLHIAAPIPNNKDKELEPDGDELYQVKWINLGIQENQFDNQDDQIFISSEWDSDFNFANREVHPANDNSAKWSLETLFVSSLEAPSFLGSDLIFTDTK
ncbi:16616_t:CDS:2 [Dentiscutata erythropus]|uniref:16616_t:CDS:1 n=1 Tax=Dentiscutata erythropus TaxID=1348616 RepID=A0A9N9HNI1_9GLOM|nr:16616_t:CDS:2 [Dentiscutata erythropus]